MVRKHKPKSLSQVMASIHSKDTRPELAVRHWLWHHGFRYRKNTRQLPGSPDIVVVNAHVAIFVHGCFWHQHPGCPAATVPHSNVDFWTAKFRRNHERDERVRSSLSALGWHTLVIWECQLKPPVFEKTMAVVAAILSDARDSASSRPQPRPYDFVSDYDNYDLAAEDLEDYDSPD